MRYRVPISLVPALAKSSRWGRIKAEIVCSMTSKYAIALYELVQLAATSTGAPSTSPSPVSGTFSAYLQALMSVGTISSNA